MEKQKYQKLPAPDVLFARFLQRQTHAPSAQQLQKWEDEGGVIPDINGDHESFADLPLSQRVGAYFSRAWKALNANFNPLEKKNIQ